MARTTLRSPVLPIDYLLDLGDEIHPCMSCLPWHVEVIRHPESGALMAREWHAVGCEIWTETE